MTTPNNETIRQVFTCCRCGTEITCNDAGAWTDNTGDGRCGNPTGVHSPGSHLHVSVEVSVDLEPDEAPTPALIAQRGWEGILALAAPIVEIRQSLKTDAPRLQFDLEDLQR